MSDRQSKAGRIPRVGPSRLPSKLAELFRPRIERLGYLGEFFQVTAHQPEPLFHFYRMTEELKTALPPNLTEVVALSSATLLDNRYERVQHERLSLKLGFSEAWVREVIALDPEASKQLSREEKLTQKLVQSVISSYGHRGGPDLDPVVSALGAEQAVGVLFLIGRYVMHGVISNCLQLAPPVPSPLSS